MAVRVEKEIQKLLRSHQDTLAAAESLIQWTESQFRLSLDEIESVANFLLKNDFHFLLTSWLSKEIRKSYFSTPWPYLLESIAISGAAVSTYLISDLREGMREEQAFIEASRSRQFDHFWEDLAKWRERLPTKMKEELKAKRDKMLLQISTYRTTNLPAQEKQILLRLLKILPNDEEVLKAFQDHRERYALDVVSRAKTKRNLSGQITDSSEVDQVRKVVQTELTKLASQNSQMAMDLCLAAMSIEDHECAWSCLRFAPESKAKDWLIPELLLKLGRHLELIDYLKFLETNYQNDSDCFFATTYFRALALHGLERTEEAILVLESLLAIAPGYRSGTALLLEWRTV